MCTPCQINRRNLFICFLLLARVYFGDAFGVGSIKLVTLQRSTAPMIHNNALMTTRHSKTLSRSAQQSKLNSVVPTKETMVAAIAIAYPTILGITVDRLQSKLPFSKYVQGITPLLTILSAAHFASLHMIPSSHYLYDICWNRLLPASLALSLLSPSFEKDDCDSSVRKRTTKFVKREIFTVSIPFILGCIGSVLGCLLSFFYCWLGKDNYIRVHKRIFQGRKHFLLTPGHLLLEPRMAAVATGCLISSYIGGSYNYFDAARILNHLPEAQSISTEMLGDTFGLTAPDILVLPMYFVIISVLSTSKIIRVLFPGYRALSTSVHASKEKSSEEHYSPTGTKQNDLVPSFLSVIVVLQLVWAIVLMSEFIEVKTSVPGVGFVFITLLSCTASKIYSKTCQTFSNDNPRKLIASITSKMRWFTVNMASVCYYMLLSVVGLSTNLQSAMLQGRWSCLSSFLFAAIPLMIHFQVLLLGSLAVMKLFSIPLGIEEVIVASNAAICGPVTAATVASNLSSKGKNHHRSKGLTIAATVWGIVGDSVGSIIGVAIARFLLSIVQSNAPTFQT